jgi:Transposase DNA-binding
VRGAAEVESKGCEGWAREEFGHADLGDTRLQERLVLMATRAAQKPAGHITSVMMTDAEREGAYRFVENEAVRAEALGRASATACARRMRSAPVTIVAVDGSSLSFKDPIGRRKMGSVGPRRARGRGIKMMTAVAVAFEGTPVGVLAQRFWRRSLVSKRTPSSQRPMADRETNHWLQLMNMAETRCRAEDVTGIRWYQGDCEAGFKEVLAWASAADDNVWVTVRTRAERRVLEEQDPDNRMLGDVLERLGKKGTYRLEVAAGPNRTARTARMEVRAAAVMLPLQLRGGRADTHINVVEAREVGTNPGWEDPIRWILLTTAPVESPEEACHVIRAYSLRWRVEEFHKCLKSVCRVEDSQLDDIDHVIRWAAIQSAVAVRIERLKHLARETPDAPATVELDAAEIEATILLRNPKGVAADTIPTIGQAVRWIADVGGYMGTSKKRGPPGTIVISRGLERITIAADVLRAQNSRRHL